MSNLKNTNITDTIHVTFNIEDDDITLTNKPTYEIRGYYKKNIMLESLSPRKISMSDISYNIKIIDIEKIIKDYTGTYVIENLERLFFIKTYEYIMSHPTYDLAVSPEVNLSFSFVC